MLHFSQVWPLEAERLRPLLGRARRLWVVEGNATGQFAAVLRQTGLLGECEPLLKYDGMPFTGEEIAVRAAS